jgi:peptidylprolyl isomerase
MVFVATLAAAQTPQPAHKAQRSASDIPLPPGIPEVAAPVRIAYALRYQEIRLGNGPAAAPGMLLTVQYTGWLAANGTEFDSSRDRPSAQFPQGEPFQFVLGGHQVIPGWDTGLVGMRIGGVRRLLIPWQLAYGDAGSPPAIPPQADLVFDVELLDATPPNQNYNGSGFGNGLMNTPTNAPPTPPEPQSPPTPDAPPTPPTPPSP